VTDNMTEVTVI